MLVRARASVCVGGGRAVGDIAVVCGVCGFAVVVNLGVAPHPLPPLLPATPGVKEFVSWADLPSRVPAILETMQADLLQAARVKTQACLEKVGGGAGLGWGGKGLGEGKRAQLCLETKILGG